MAISPDIRHPTHHPASSHSRICAGVRFPPQMTVPTVLPASRGASCTIPARPTAPDGSATRPAWRLSDRNRMAMLAITDEINLESGLRVEHLIDAAIVTRRCPWTAHDSMPGRDDAWAWQSPGLPSRLPAWLGSTTSKPKRSAKTKRRSARNWVRSATRTGSHHVATAWIAVQASIASGKSAAAPAAHPARCRIRGSAALEVVRAISASAWQTDSPASKMRTVSRTTA